MFQRLVCGSFIFLENYAGNKSYSSSICSILNTALTEAWIVLHSMESEGHEFPYCGKLKIETNFFLNI